MKSKKMKTKVMVLVICAVFLVAMSAVSLASTATNTEDKQSVIFENKELNHAPSAMEYAPDEILVKFKPYAGEDAINTMNSEYKTSVKSTLLSGTNVLNVPPGKTVDEMVSIYANLPDVEYAEPNYVVRAFMVPNDPGYSLQWHLDNDEYGGINMESAWDVSTGTGVVVAVLDTGVAYEDYGIYCQAPDLAGTTFVQGYDYANDDAHPNDDQGHGTHVTGTIAQTTNNGLGVAGVAFGCSIMPVKVLNATGSGSHSWIANGIRYAADNGADVISMSLGGSSSSQTMEDAVAYAYNNGVTLIASAGNDYEEGNPTNYPAAYDDYVIAVGATRYDETRSWYSSTGSYLDIAAPGGDTSVDQNEDSENDGVLQQTFSGGDPCNFGYWFFQGTSMAAPHVSGVAALLIANGVTGPDNVRNRLQSTAEDKGTPGWDEEYGWGIVDALAVIGPGENQPPYKPSNPSPSDGATNVPTNTLLSWSGGDPDGDTVNYDVYLGTTTAPSLVSSVSTTSYNPSLNPNTHYYWKINATDSHNAFNTSELWEFTTGAGAVEANWTFMVYLDGDNNLEGAGIDDMNEMEVVGSTSNVNIIVQFDRIPGYDSTNGDWTGTRRYYVTQDANTATISSTLIQDLDEVDMADQNVLVDFVEWAMQNYPASNYALILWNHGSGWKYQGGKWVPWEDSEIPIRLKEDEKRAKDPIKGIIYDDTSGTHLSMSELKQALNTIKTDTCKKMDVLGFDACLMQMIEVAYQVKDYSDVMVGSEETEPGDGWPYDTILSNLTANPLMTPSGLGSEIVADYLASYGTSGSETQSAANQTKLSNLVSAVDNFAQVLNESLSGYSDEVASARLQTESYHDADYIDLYHFAELINASVSDNTVKTAATAVMNNITNTIFAEAHGSGHPNSHGMTIYFPISQSNYRTSYENIDFANDTKWDEFLNGFYFYCYDSPVIVPGANILLVDDDLGSSYEVYYKAALNANGYNYSYWNIANDESPNTTILSDHSIVIWFTGDDSFTTLESTDQTNLQTYLNAGGNLFISGQDIGYNIVEMGGTSSQTFYTNYLHAQYELDDSGITTLNGISGDPIGDGLTIGISGGDGANNQNYPSVISPKDAYTSYVFNYTGDDCGAIKANTTHKVVYFAFGFEAINSSADRNTVMSRVISWFGGAEAGVPDIWVSPTSFNVTLPQNTVSNETLIIGNNGNGALTYSITDSESKNNPSSSERLSLKEKYADTRSPDLVLTKSDYDMSIAVEDVSRIGRYTEATADGKKLLYGYPSAGTSYATIRLDGTDDYYQDSTMDTYVTQTPTTIGDSIKTTWTLPNSMDVSETLTLMPNTTKYHFTVKNNDVTSHSVRIRYLFDTMLAYNDGAPFIVPGVGEVTTEQEYINPVFDYWKATDDLVNPTLTSNCTFVPGNKPYKVQFAYWQDIYGYPFDYTITSGQSITSDTAVGMYWNLGTVSPGETKDVIVYYGIAGAILGAPEIAITSLLTDQDSYSPGQNVSVYIDVGNGGNATLTNGQVAVTINNPSDTTIFEDNSSVTIDPNAVVSTNFTYGLSADATAGTYTVTAEVYDSGMNLLDNKTTNFEVVSGVDWLSESPTSGTVNPSNQTNITVTINTTGLSVGEYYANITIANNDPDENPVIVPVILTVGSPGEIEYFDTGSGTYPSISGTHTGTIELSCNVNVSKMYTYPCVGTGGHTEYVRIYGDVVNESKTWDGYTGDYHSITFDSPFTLVAGKTYNYEIRTGSYPQIIHASSKEVTGGTINCTSFVDANGKTYTDWIPAIRLE